ncbi:MAG TPA: SIMPL domain-containing protein [Gemmatimonadaceae bacterium]|nr:SIMPL domain-containing protein [Gemmatimonadaceae bacterium]
MTLVRSILPRARASATRRALVPALLAGLAMAGAPSVLSAQSMMTRQPPQISVTAQGSVDVTPDRARITLGVETEAKTAQEAAQANAAAQTRVVEALRRLGIPAASIRTSGYNVAPKQQYLPETRTWRVDGYQVSNLVVVTVEPVAKAGEIIDAALSAGANRVAGLSFEVKDPTAAREQAIEEAVTRARREATLAAKAAGGEVVGLLELTVNSFEASPRPMMEMVAMRADASSTPISEGTQQVVVSVSTQWEFRRLAPTDR